MRVRDTVYNNDEPVTDEQARALALNEAIREPVSEFLDEQRERLKKAVGAGGALAVAGLGLFGIGIGIGLVVFLAGIAVAGGGYYYVTQQEPDVQIHGIEKGYWTGYSLPGDDGVLFYDATGAVSESEFQLEQVSDEQRIKDAKTQLEETGDFPVVMADDQNVEEEFTGALEEVQSELDATDSFEVDAPVLSEDSPETAAIGTLVDHAEPGSVEAETEVDVDQARQELEDLSKLGNLAEDHPVEDELREMSEIGRSAAEDLSGHQDDAVETLNAHIQTAADAFGIVSYNFYCPDCHEDGIESELTVPDSTDEDLYCETCRSHQDREDAIPRHKLKDELVLPIWDQLWAQKADEKREIYENIEDQKHELKEREYEQYQEEIRTTTERIRDMRSKIRNLETQARAAEGAVDEISELLTKYERLNEERKQKFKREVKQAYKEIDTQTQEVLDATRSEEQKRLDEAERKAEEKAELLRAEERQRQAEMLSAQRQMQEDIAKAQMEHQEKLTKAQIDQEMTAKQAELQQSAKHHREDWMLETRGETSMSDTIDMMKMKKDRLLGASAGGE